MLQRSGSVLGRDTEDVNDHYTFHEVGEGETIKGGGGVVPVPFQSIHSPSAHSLASNLPCDSSDDFCLSFLPKHAHAHATQFNSHAARASGVCNAMTLRTGAR